MLTKPYFTDNLEKSLRMLVEIYDISQIGAERRLVESMPTLWLPSAMMVEVIINCPHETNSWEPRCRTITVPDYGYLWLPTVSSMGLLMMGLRGSKVDLSPRFCNNIKIIASKYQIKLIKC